MIIAILLVEWMVLLWAGRLVKNSLPLATKHDFYWKIIRGMAWRLLILAAFPIPEIVFLLVLSGRSPSGAFTAMMSVFMAAMILYPLILLSVMWRVKSLVDARYSGKARSGSISLSVVFGCLLLAIGFGIGFMMWITKQPTPENTHIDPATARLDEAPSTPFPLLGVIPSTPPPSAPPAASEWKSSEYVAAEEASRSEAVRMYPPLGVANSQFNQAFVSEYQRRKSETPRFFDDPEWPVKLCGEIAPKFGFMPPIPGLDYGRRN